MFKNHTGLGSEFASTKGSSGMGIKLREVERGEESVSPEKSSV